MNTITEIPTETTERTVNIAARVARCAERHPDKPAVIACNGRDRRGHTRYTAISFRELAGDIDAYARGLQRIGVTRGMRTILMVRPGCSFFALTFALLKTGAVPVLIDPGMGRRKLIDCLAGVDAEAFIGIPLAHLARKLYARAFRSVRITVTVGKRLGWGGWRLDQIRDTTGEFREPAPTRAGDPAAILFTSGSTGPAKGVVYTHGIFDAQVRCLAAQYNYTPAEVDLATFPLFALFDAALGMTAVIPKMDASKPAHVDPRNIIAAVRDHNVTHMFASPALLNRVSRYCVERNITLPTIKRAMTAGAPVPTAVLERMRRILPAHAEIHTPYGATEALPVASIESRTIIAETSAATARGEGICVGEPLPGIDVRIIAITDNAIAEMNNASVLPSGEIGEICVRGPVVTREYFRKPEATSRAKIRDGDTIWHRMGDVGYLDEKGRLWFCGRKAHRVRTAQGTLFSICCEAVFNQHPQVYRTALVGIGQPGAQTPVLCVELECTTRGTERREVERRGTDHKTIDRELLDIAAANELTRDIRTILFHKSFPVDVRHNAKIAREKLADWVTQEQWK